MTIRSVLGKSSVAPTVPTVTVPTYANLATEAAYPVTVRGQAGSIASVVVTDSAGNVANGMDIIDSTGTVLIPVDVSQLIDGVFSVSVTLTNGIGNSMATVVTSALDTAPPSLTVTPVPSAIVPSNVGGVSVPVWGERGATVAYVFSDGTHTVTGSATFNGSGKTTFWSGSLSSLADGVITLTVTETDPAGNPTVYTQSLVKDTTPPVIASSITAPSNGTRYDVTQSILVTFGATDAVSGVASVTATLDGVAIAGGTVIRAEALSAGTHAIVITSVDALGNTSTKTLTITVRATVTGLQGAVSYGVSNGWITSSSVASKLQSDLSAAAAALASNNHAAAKTALAAFASDITSNSKWIASSYATLLKGWAADLSSSL